MFDGGSDDVTGDAARVLVSLLSIVGLVGTSDTESETSVRTP